LHVFASFRSLAVLAALTCAGCASPGARDSPRFDRAALDRRVEALMAQAHVPGLALALVRDGQVAYVKGYGERNTERQLPLQADTVMYAASLTKATFAYGVMMMADEGRIDLDRSIDALLAKPLPEYDKYADLAGDERWRMLTPRILLSHRSGFANFRFWQPGKPYDPDGKLFFYFDPGTRFAYSGEGINLLQFALENGGGVDVGDYLGTHLFERFGMARTSLTWRKDFEGNVAIGYDEHGAALGHKQRGSVRAAGSMDTTVDDYAHLLAAMVRGDGLRPATHAAWQTPQVRIRSAQQFPTMGVADTGDDDGIALSYALGIERVLRGLAGDDRLKLAADAALHLVAQQGGGGAVVRQGDLGGPLAETSRPALDRALQGVAVRRIEIGDGDVPGEDGADRADLGPHRRLIGVVADLGHGLAALDAPGQYVGVVERPPDRLPRRLDPVFPGLLHRSLTSWRIGAASAGLP